MNDSGKVGFWKGWRRYRPWRWETGECWPVDEKEQRGEDTMGEGDSKLWEMAPRRKETSQEKLKDRCLWTWVLVIRRPDLGTASGFLESTSWAEDLLRMKEDVVGRGWCEDRLLFQPPEGGGRRFSHRHSISFRFSPTEPGLACALRNRKAIDMMARVAIASVYWGRRSALSSWMH